ncbi:MAG TPA: DegT/DnrJ/EryC1/StrS family aminotransferase [Phycisphaerales bacterium]|nr:DegT/DnrJ/EryC1/StrS family aminotransferase [Phycisphaerales bacterium]HMP35836.1 DegT/DnrJ/EryC1/StrS family aminotransferase [Phycisphaerales bacterium]
MSSPATPAPTGTAASKPPLHSIDSAASASMAAAVAPAGSHDPVAPPIPALDPERRPALRKLALFGGTPVAVPTIQVVSVRMGDDEIDAVAAVLRSGRLAQGAVVKEFEAAFADQTGARHAIACSNGTTALQLVYQVLLKAGESAVTPGWTFIATASMIRARPARPIFGDVLEESFNLDLASVAPRLREDTRLLVPVHLYGNPADIDCIDAFAARRGLSVVYDAAQSHLATYRGRPIGAYGAATTYSFYPTKNMTTAEGGMVTTNDDGLADELRVVRDHGMRVRYLHETLGFNYRMTDIFAAIGLAQLRRLPQWTARRQENAAALTRRLAGVPGIATPTAEAHASHVYHLYTLRLDPATLGCDRDTFARALNAEGVATAVHYPRPLNRQPVFMADPEVDCAPLPVAERLAESVLSLPVHPHLGDAEVAAVAEAVLKVAEAVRAR